jgi:hypothetical protein
MTGTQNPFDMSKMAFGGLGQMFDGMETMKRAWSVFNTSSPLVPTLDVDELDKRIADLKAVEQWLNLNVSMLHGTIQGLEIQRGTLAALKAFGANFDPSGAGAATNPFAPRPQASPSPNAGWPSPPAAKPSRSNRAAPDAPAAEPVRETPEAPTRARNAASADAAAAASTASSGAPGIDAGAWWNLLQGTFNQVAQAALSGAGLPGMGRTAPAAAEPAPSAPSSIRGKPRSRTR